MGAKDGMDVLRAIKEAQPLTGGWFPTGDVARIVGAPDTDWESDEWGDRGLRPEAADRYLRLHVETGIALKISLATGGFRVGRYICTDVWGNDWRRE